MAAKRVDHAYDAAMRRTTLTRYSDLAGTTTVQVTAYGYDAADRLTSLTHKTGGGTTRASYGYTLDAADRLTSESRAWASGGSTDTVSYTYTNDDQLTGVTHTNGSFASESFSFDANGNRTMIGYSTSTGNRLSGDGTFTYGYDDEGNLTSKTETSTGNQTLYSWDHRNRLTAVDTVISGVTTRIGTYTYDALDRRIKVVANGTTRATLYDGMSAILDFNGSGTQTARYLQGPVIDEILAREVSGTVAWYLQDRLNTVRDVVDNAGAIIDHVDYEVFGKVAAESNPGNGDRWKFTGRELDTETGLYQYRSRYYDTAAGRFVSEDRIGFGGGDANLYRYVKNGATIWTDPLGQDIYLVPTAEFPGGTYHYSVVAFDPVYGDIFAWDGVGPGWGSGGRIPPLLLFPGSIGNRPLKPTAGMGYHPDLKPVGKPILVSQGNALEDYVRIQTQFDKMKQIPFYAGTGFGAPNSNTFANALLSNCGLNPKSPPKAIGWNSPYYGGLPISTESYFWKYDKYGNLIREGVLWPYPG